MMLMFYAGDVELKNLCKATIPVYLYNLFFSHRQKIIYKC
jgi:hypothetical protein